MGCPKTPCGAIKHGNWFNPNGGVIGNINYKIINMLIKTSIYRWWFYKKMRLYPVMKSSTIKTSICRWCSAIFPFKSYINSWGFATDFHGFFPVVFLWFSHSYGISNTPYLMTLVLPSGKRFHWTMETISMLSMGKSTIPSGNLLHCYWTYAHL